MIQPNLSLAVCYKREVHLNVFSAISIGYYEKNLYSVGYC